MKRRRTLFALLGVIFGAGAALAACDLATNGIAMDGTQDGSAEGAASDASSSDALDELGDATGSDGQGDAPDDAGDTGTDAIAADAGSFHCGGGFVSNCLSCAGAQALCGDTCVASCHDSCPASQIECVACNAANTPTTSLCVPPANATGCLGGANVRCTCLSTDAGECPGLFQVCSTAVCLNCGESSPVNTDNQVCRGGTGAHKCDNGSGGGKLTCH